MADDQFQNGSNVKEKFAHYMPGQHFVQGILFNKDIHPDNEQYVQFQTRPDDVLISAFPKSGTTWLTEIIHLIQHSGDFASASQRPVEEIAPLIDFALATPLAVNMSSPRLYRSHHQFHLLPNQIRNNRIRIIHIMRDPKDVAVSFFHFYRAYQLLSHFGGSWDEFLDMFLEGYVSFGSWFDYTRSWWPRRQLDNILFLRYEDVKRDHKGTIKQIAKFLNARLSTATLNEIQARTTFEKMKANPMTNGDQGGAIDVGISQMIRKGLVGDWKNHFTETQQKRFDQVCFEKLGDLQDIALDLWGI